MNITQRTCKNCAHFNPAPDGDEPTCWNLVSISENYRTPQAMHREPSAVDWCDHHQTHAEDAAEIHEIEVAQQLKEATPEFMVAMSECLLIVESLGIDHPDAKRAMQRAMLLASPSMQAFMSKQVDQLGLMPQADGYTEDSEPVFSLESIAAKLDISRDEAKAAMEAILSARESLGLPSVLIDPATVYLKH